MTSKSIDVLSEDENGFFLMVEGAQIDFSGHDNDKIGVTLETIAFDKAVEVALDYVEQNQDTILIVTADHETGGLIVTGDMLNQELPSESNSDEENRDLRIARAQNVTVGWGTTGHTDTLVPFYYFGDSLIDLGVNGTIDNTEIYNIMKSHIDPNNTVTMIPERAPTTTTITTIPLPDPISMDIVAIITIACVVSVATLIVAIFFKRG
jgi:alkaline phosphatase